MHESESIPFHKNSCQADLSRSVTVSYGKYTGTVSELRQVFVKVTYDPQHVAEAASQGKVIHLWPRASRLTKLIAA